MKDDFDKVIYVGKAKNLKNRVSQYFNLSKNHSQKVISMVKNIKSFEYIITNSELEALILECSLIKEYKPKYNILLRDDKTYPYIKITTNEEYPKLIKTRKVLKDKCKYFGPYTDILAVNETIDTLKSIYPIRTCNIDINKSRNNENFRPCLNLHINKCFGPCQKSFDKEIYDKMIDEIIMILSSKEQILINKLTEKMNECASNLDFEKAKVYRDKIKSIENISKKQIIDLKSDLNQDVLAVVKFEDIACIEIFFIRGGKVSRRESFIFENVKEELESEILANFIKQFYSQNEFIPKEIIIEKEIEEINLLEEFLSFKKNQKVKIKIPQKGDKKALINITRKNAFESLEKFIKNNKKNQKEKVLKTLQEMLELKTFPKRIECFDISNISGVYSVGGMVVFTNGVKDKKEYRKFKIKTVSKSDDYSSLCEVIKRRIEKGNLPDLILLDGGRGQVSAVSKVLSDNNLDTPLFGLFKDDFHKTKGIINLNKSITLDKTTEIYRFLACIQEEVHNFSINYHRNIRNKSLTKSVLDDIQGVGEKRKKALLSYFKNINSLKNASIDEISKVEGISKNLATQIYEFFSKGD